MFQQSAFYEVPGMFLIEFQGVSRYFGGFQAASDGVLGGLLKGV